MRYCANCHTPLTFIAVLTSLYPAQIRCRSCQQNAKVSALHSLIACIAVLALLLGSVVLANTMGHSLPTVIALIIALSAVFEYAFYWSLQRGFIPSSLVRIDQATQKTHVYHTAEKNSVKHPKD